MNKKLETIGKLFSDKFLTEHNIYFDYEKKSIEFLDDYPITVFDLYKFLIDIFDEPELLMEKTPLKPVYTFSGAEVVNEWSITFQNKEYKCGDIIKK